MATIYLIAIAITYGLTLGTGILTIVYFKLTLEAGQPSHSKPLIDNFQGFILTILLLFALGLLTNNNQHLIKALNHFTNDSFIATCTLIIMFLIIILTTMIYVYFYLRNYNVTKKV